LSNQTTDNKKRLRRRDELHRPARADGSSLGLQEISPLDTARANTRRPLHKTGEPAAQLVGRRSRGLEWTLAILAAGVASLAALLFLQDRSTSAPRLVDNDITSGAHAGAPDPPAPPVAMVEDATALVAGNASPEPAHGQAAGSDQDRGPSAAAPSRAEVKRIAPTKLPPVRGTTAQDGPAKPAGDQGGPDQDGDRNQGGSASATATKVPSAPEPIAAVDGAAPRAPARPPPPPPAPQFPGSFSASASISLREVSGSLPRSVVQRAVSRVAPEYRSCYEQAARGSGNKARLQVPVSFVVAEMGRAKLVQVNATPLPGLSECIAEVTGKIRTRISPDIGDVNVSLVISYRPDDG
jgi:hypothetical protein